MRGDDYTSVLVKIRQIPVITSKLNKIFLMCSITIIVSGILSIIFNLRKLNIDKNSFLTGIPFLRTYFFYVNLLIFILIFSFQSFIILVYLVKIKRENLIITLLKQ